MNIDENFLNKIPNSLTYKKDHSPWSSGICPWDGRMVQRTQTNKCNTAHQWNEKKFYDELNWLMKSIWQNLASIHDKNP